MTNSHVVVTTGYATSMVYLLGQLSLLENAFRLLTSLLFAIAGFRVFYGSIACVSNSLP